MIIISPNELCTKMCPKHVGQFKAMPGRSCNREAPAKRQLCILGASKENLCHIDYTTLGSRGVLDIIGASQFHDCDTDGNYVFSEFSECIGARVCFFCARA